MSSESGSIHPSIKHDLLIKKLRRKIRKRQALSLISSAITTDTVAEGPRRLPDGQNDEGVPQGLAISNILAEVFIADFDDYMNKQSDIVYLRYVDDILILCKAGCSNEIARSALRFLKDMRLNPHEISADSGKSSIGDLGTEFDFLGYRVVGNKLSIRTPSIHKFESSLARIFTAYRYRALHAKDPAERERAKVICEWRLNLRITGCIFEGKRLGWVFYFSQINDTSPLRHLDRIVESFKVRFGLSGIIKTKRTLKTFYEAARTDKSTHRYIVNFDGMTIDEKRTVLEKFLGANSLARASADEIEKYFKMRISTVVKELEVDVADIS